MSFSTKKYELVSHNGLVFDSENEGDMRNKMGELRNHNLLDGMTVRNNITGEYDYAWRAYINLQDCKVWDSIQAT
jgi:hypothetical protein